MLTNSHNSQARIPRCLRQDLDPVQKPNDAERTTKYSDNIATCSQATQDTGTPPPQVQMKGKQLLRTLTDMFVTSLISSPKTLLARPRA